MSKPTLGPAELREQVGIGVHTGFRKGTDARGSAKAWKAISADDSGWSDALEYLTYGLEVMFPDGFVYDPKKETP